MDVSSCVLEVDVNGEEVFIVDKEIISSYSDRISKLSGKRTNDAKLLKVFFHDFPVGAVGFELMARFCYNYGKTELNPSNLLPLYSIAHFMEMNKSICNNRTLVEQTENSLEEIRHWSWSELLVALKQCQDLAPFEKSSNILQKCVDCLVTRLAFASETFPCSSIFSPESSSIRISSKTSTESLKSSSLRGTWWFEDLVAFNPNLVELIVKSMVSLKFDHGIISKFLVNYQNSRTIRAKSDDKREVLEIVINSMYLLDKDVISYKSLFRILRVALNLGISKCCKIKLESMIGMQMELATLDDLLIPSPNGRCYLYDVNLVLRFLKSFLEKGTSRVPLVNLKKVAILMDLYISEVAPDPCLKPSKFLALVWSLPDHSRDSYDGIYRALEIYLQVHNCLSEEDKNKVCCGLNYKKLSSETLNCLANNQDFPSRSGIQALLTHWFFPKGLLQQSSQVKYFNEPPCTSSRIDSKHKKDYSCDQIVGYGNKLGISKESGKLRDRIQSMQGRVLELEKICKKMQSQMSKMTKSRLSSQSSGCRSLPRLCS